MAWLYVPVTQHCQWYDEHVRWSIDGPIKFTLYRQNPGDA
jgi:hypothetical protein